MFIIKDRTVWLVLLAIVCAVGGYYLYDWWRGREQRIFYEEVLRPLHAPHHNEEGFWVGDIAELHRLGQISRELAEADTAPLNPLVPKPIPFHGYFVRALESGPSFSNSDPTPLSFKGQKRSRESFAILIYPVEPGPGKDTVLYSAAAVYRRRDNWTPVFQYPTDQERIKSWAIVD